MGLQYVKRVKKASWCQTASEIRYSGKFSNGANFRIFRMLAPYSKIKTAKIRTARAAARSAVRGGNNVSVQLHVLCRSFEAECPS